VDEVVVGKLAGEGAPEFWCVSESPRMSDGEKADVKNVSPRRKLCCSHRLV
jgi:hypothetical protein